MEEKIVEMYTNGSGIEAICMQFKIGKLKVKSILNKQGVTLKKKGAQIKYKTVDKIDLTDKILSCKHCKKQFNDVENKSGNPLSHLLEHQPGLDVPSAHLRRQHLKSTGSHWHLQFYDLLDKPLKDLLECPLCDWTSPDLSNKTGALTKHVETHHNSILSFVTKFPDYRNLFKVFNLKEKRDVELAKDSVICHICQQPMKYINEKHLNKHGITLRDYKVKYLGQKFMSDSTIIKLQTSYENGLRHFENSFKSKAEEEIATLIRSLGIEVLSNDKKALKGTELDIYLPGLKMAFEYNGLYYHTERMGKGRWFHLHKQDLAKKHGIGLIHIFEDEWIHRKEHCLSKIVHMLGVSKTERIYGRKTQIKEITYVEADKFLDQNHIQGSTLSKTTSYGAFYHDKLVAVMSFLNSKKVWNLTRYATDARTHCVGVASKLLNEFVKNKNPKTIISFADRRWTIDPNDNLYIKLGFQLEGIIPPDYRYVNGVISRNMRLHKFGFRKKILLRKYPNLVNANMTEKEMTTILGFDRIWDCGLFKYVMNF